LGWRKIKESALGQLLGSCKFCLRRDEPDGRLLAANFCLRRGEPDGRLLAANCLRRGEPDGRLLAANFCLRRGEPDGRLLGASRGFVSILHMDTKVKLLW
jgi:hypothetical protein